MGFPIKVVETLKQIFADTLGGEEVRFEEETETIFSLRCEETDEWIAVVAATSDSQALADAEEARSMDPPPERVIAVCQKAGVHRKKLADMFAFDECELMYNVMKHSTVPPVTKLTDSEKVRIFFGFFLFFKNSSEASGRRTSSEL